jgi:hypothetical protein
LDVESRFNLTLMVVRNWNMKSRWWMSLCLAGALAVGCNQSQDPEVVERTTDPDPSVAAESPTPGKSPAATSGTKRPSVKLPVNDASEPADVVDAFLRALKSGDEQVAEGLLTTTAQIESARHNLQVKPPGTPSATYKIGQSAVCEEDETEVHVETEWTENDAEDKATTESVIFVLRHETGGWRVAGMAAYLNNHKEPSFLNFEDPADMFSVLEIAAREAAAREAAEKEAAAVEEKVAEKSTTTKPVRQATIPSKDGKKTKIK